MVVTSRSKMIFLYFILFFFNLFSTIYIINRFSYKFFYASISILGIYFSLISISLFALLKLLRKDRRDVVFLLLLIPTFIVSTTYFVNKEAVIFLLQEHPIDISFILYIISGIIYFYCTAHVYKFFLK